MSPSISHAAAKLFVLPLFAALVITGHAQRSLLTVSIDETARVTLNGNVHPLVHSATDLGAVSDTEPTGTLLLVLGRSPEQQASLNAFAKAASMPGTPEYHQWLTPATFARQFGASSSDIEQVKNWLSANGFTVEKVAAGGNIIRFSGNMGAIRSTFGTEIHRYQIGTTVHMANATEPSIPAALAPIVRGLAALTDIRPKSQLVRGPHKPTPGSQPEGGVRPDLTTYGPLPWGPWNNTTAYDVNFLPAAGDAAMIYDTPNSAMNSKYSGTTWTGAGVKVGIAGDSNYGSTSIGDIAYYRTMFLNETLVQAQVDPQLPQIVVDGADPGANGDELEALIDVEQVMALAPKALTTLYVAADTDLQPGLFLAMQRAIDDNTVSILNVSFSECEADLGASGNLYLNELLEQAAAQGISVTVSAGDSGSANCDGYTFGFNATTSSGLAVNGIASTPWNIAVGGTDFDVLSSTNLSTFAQYVNVPSGPNAIAAAPPYYVSALGYIPEEPWNNSTSVFTTYDQNIPFKYGNGPENTMAGGGGVSSAAVCSGSISSSSGACSVKMTGYAKPAFQTSLTPADSVRDVPDVSLFSGTLMDDGGYTSLFPAAWSFCADGRINGDGNYTDCLPYPGNTGCNGTCVFDPARTYTTPVGGTSTAAPSMAGILAVVSQSQGGVRLGQADYVLYNLAANYPGSYHDITTGNNSVLCTAGTTNCGSNGFITGYNAGTGYDLATGIGSLDVAKLVSNWSKASFVGTTTTMKVGTSSSSLRTSALTVAHGTPVYFQISVTPATATGYVALASNNAQSNSDGILTAALSNGIATFSTAGLPGGSYTLYAHYGGDSNNTASQSAGIQFTVSAESSTLQFNLNTYSAQTGAALTTPVYGSYIYADVVPYGSTEGFGKGNQATGTVTLSEGGTTLAALSIGSGGDASYDFPGGVFPSTGTYTFSAAYSGDASYKASTGTKSVTLVKATPVDAAVGANQSWSPTANNTGVGMSFNIWSLGVAPTGSIVVTMNGASFGSSAIQCSLNPNNSVEWICGNGVSVTPAQIGVGNSATFTVAYTGDGNYQAIAPISQTVTVTEPTGAGLAVTNSGTTTIATPGQTGTNTITVTPTGGFVGVVTFSCSLTSGGTGSYNPTCSIPSSATITGSIAQTTTLTISTTAATTAALQHGGFGWTTGCGIAFAVLAFVFVPRRGRRMLSVLAAVLAVGSVLLTVAGCGSGGPAHGGGGVTTIPGTPAGTYTFTVTGVHGAITGSSVVTVTLQ